jgi:lipopolysaccharide export system protein LptA
MFLKFPLPLRRIRWQQLMRVGIAVGLAVFAAILFGAIREREVPVTSQVVERVDPDAVVESRGTQLTQADGAQENFSLDATQQLTYPDGSVRFVDDVVLTVPEQANREHFTVTGTEASIDEAQTSLVVSGDVVLTVADGMVVRTGSAMYESGTGQIIMQRDSASTSLSRAGLEASGRNVVYERNAKAVTLTEAARVRLTGDDTRASVDISAHRAILAQAERYMHFEGGTAIDMDLMAIGADSATMHLGADETSLESLELVQDTIVQSTDPASGLRQMAARETTLVFDGSRSLEQTTLTGDATVELKGKSGGPGSRIGASSIDVTMTPSGNRVMAIAGGGGVQLRLPATPDGPRQEIRAMTLVGTGTPEIGLTAVQFERDVQYREERAASATNPAITRVVHAQRLAGGVDTQLTALLKVEFLGDVTFQDDRQTVEADQANYDVIQGVISLASVGDTGRKPRVIDERNSIEATTLDVTLDGSALNASGGVQNVITPQNHNLDDAGTEKTPALLNDDQQIFVTASELNYSGEPGVATYNGSARLWQGPTSFEGDLIEIDNGTGGLTASGAVRTAIQIIRLNEDTQNNEVTLTRAEADKFEYDDVGKHAAYTGNAVLRSRLGDLKATTIHVFLKPDGRTLDRLEARGAVQLQLDGRWAAGESMTYHETEGRYEMEGSPVEMVEQIEPEEPETSVPGGAAPPPQDCRSTQGQALTFFRANDTIIVDGRERLRTETNNNDCEPLIF